MRKKTIKINQHENHCIVSLAIGIFLFALVSVQSFVNAQVDTSYSFIAAGHAYGSHTGGNLGLHPALLNSLDSGYDSNTAFIVFTGDIVNQSTSESWQQVEDELSNYPIPNYYVMGNHDANDIGRQVFEDRFGGTYYAFHWQSELFIVLNSTEQDRSISPNQLDFLEEQLNQSGDTIRNIFIFFHEILWNSHEKYIGVMSNTRSRYDQMVNYSNYWEDVHPMLLGKPGKNFFLIAGDVGGNADAIAAIYDVWDNITLLASGMGEVVDENYLLIRVYSDDSVSFELIPLNIDLSLPDIKFYSVPHAPEAITGPDIVPQGGSAIEYSVPEVFNATSYIWELPEGAAGTSTSNSIAVDFETDFAGGNISVKASREGFGAWQASEKMIEADIAPIELPENNFGALNIRFIEANNLLIIGINNFVGDILTIHIVDVNGRLLKAEIITATDEYTEIQIDKSDFSTGILFLSVSTRTQRIIQKFVIR